MSLTGFLARGNKGSTFCGHSETVFVFPCKLLISKPLITNYDPLLIKRPRKKTVIKERKERQINQETSLF